MSKRVVPVGDGPREVRVVDLESPAPELRALRSDGTRWAGAWLVARWAGAPIALVEVEYAGRDVVPAGEVAQVLDDSTRGLPRRALPVVPDAELPSVSVVVPSDLRRAAALRTSLVALNALDHPDFEVVLVDNSRGGAEGVADAAVAGLERVRVVREPIPGISAARNAGVRAARGEVIAFTDDDVEVDPGWLRALATRFALRPDEDVVTGLILPAQLETVAQLWFERQYGGFGGVRTFAALTYRGTGADQSPARRARVHVEDWAGQPVRSFAVYGAGVCGAGANMAFRAGALRDGFDLALGTGTAARGGEDLAMVMSVLWNGGVVGYEPAAVVFHTHREDYEELRGQIRAYGLGYTATLSSLVADDPRHLAGLVSQLPAVAAARLRSLRPTTTTTGSAPQRRNGPPPPRELTWLSRWGSLQGPGAYRRSRRELSRRMG